MLKRFALDIKSIREEKKISLVEIANETRIHISAFEKMERGDFTFQPQTYIKAFLKQYAKYLELDENEIVHDYNLARSGNYHPKTKPEVDVSKDTKDVKKDDDKFADTFEEVPGKDKQESEESMDEEEPKDEILEDEDIEESTSKKIPKIETAAFNYTAEGKKPLLEKSPSFNPKILKNIGWAALFILILVGVYFIINELILNDPSTKKMEIVRQSFDDVVKESEWKLLGKRSKEEIEDSIRKAREYEASLLEETGDTLTLEIISLTKGELTVITDSLKTEKAEYSKNELGIWKARKFFVISSNNTSSFNAILNGDTLEFTDRRVDGVMITKDGLVKK